MFAQALSNKNNKNILKSKYRFYLSERYWNGGNVQGINIKIITLDFHQLCDLQKEKIQDMVREGLIEKNLNSEENLRKIMDKITPLKNEFMEIKSNMNEIVEKSSVDLPKEKKLLFQIINGEV